MILRIVLGLSAGAILLAGVVLWTPAPRFDRDAAMQAAKAYDARIVRDAFGVPHIYGARDADVAFGLAYAHAEDDWATMEEVVFFSRGDLAQRTGRDGAVTDYLIAALNVWPDIDAKYEMDLPADVRAVVEAYAAGVNFWCAEEKGRCARGVAPVTGKDIVAGFVSRTPFFYGLDESLTALFESEPERRDAALRARTAFLKTPPETEFGSNAMAVAPSRSADGHTRLMVNSHQPYEGPVAWYEARLKSEEGWDMIGGVFPGAPMILHGAGPDLGWAHTVNKPDLVDIYRLEVDNAEKPTRYRFDGAWRDLERSKADLRVKLFGPFSLPVSRPVYRSAHGPVFVTPGGVFAVAYGGAGNLGAPEQWYRMNKAATFEEWRAAMAIQGVPSFTATYADRTGRIAFFYNAAIPVRDEGQDWTKIADGADPALVWRGVMPFGTAPQIVDPASGYVVNANHTPFETTGAGDNPDPADFPAHYGVDQRTTNRGLRIQELYGGDESITAEEFVAYKFDHFHAPESRLRRLIANVAADPATRQDDDLRDALTLLESWDGSTAKESREAALALRFGALALGYLLNGANAEEPDPAAALRRAAGEIEAGFGRLDPEWSEAMILKRGDLELPLNGGPDALRAVYGRGDPADGAQKATGGDTYILYADWPADGGAPTIRTIHQYGAATLDKTSPHYADQAPLFAAETWRTPPMTLEGVLAEATRDYRVGGDAPKSRQTR